MSAGLLGLACGGTSASEEQGGGAGAGAASGGSAGASSAGTSSSGGGSSSGAAGASAAGTGGSVAGAGGSGAGDFIDELMASWDLVCREVKRCYPELQTDPGRCSAPGDAGRSVVWPDTSTLIDEQGLAEIEACLRAVEDQAALQTWAECATSAERSEAECLAACPASAEACVLAGNAASEACVEPPSAPTFEECLEPG